jgi:haloalkane dehalogenase
MKYAKRRIAVDGRRMAVVDEGQGRPIVFVHGNATSSYMWRNIMPQLEGLGRLIAIDNIGQGDSDKLPDSGPHSYMLAEHQRYFDGALAALGVTGGAILVMHDWGGPLGLSWAERHPAAVRGLAHCEIVATDHPRYEDYVDGHGERLRAVRGPDGERLVLDDNFFVEQIFSNGVIRTMDEAAMAEIRRPYTGPRESRRPTLSWARQIPIEGQPAEVAHLVERLAGWMTRSDLPKLFIDAEPGQIILDRDREVIATWPNQTTVRVRGKHHPQEDSPDDIAQGLATWVRQLE